MRTINMATDDIRTYKSDLNCLAQVNFTNLCYRNTFHYGKEKWSEWVSWAGTEETLRSYIANCEFVEVPTERE